MQNKITIKEIAKLAGKSEVWIRVLLSRDGAPRPVDLGKQVYQGRVPDSYSLEEVNVWLKKLYGPKGKVSNEHALYNQFMRG